MPTRRRIKPLMSERAKALRKNVPVPERLLWGRLRGKRACELRFRRQEVIGPYIADFVCPEVRLVIELDGDSHDTTAKYDSQRDAYLKERGYTVLHFSDDEVIRDLEGVLQAVSNAVRHLQLSTPTLPSP